MGSYYTHKKWAPFDSDRVLIYKIKDSPKGSYYVRIKRAGKGKGYWSKSLDCVDERTALKRAREYWVQMITSESMGVVYGQSNFGKLFQEWLGKVNMKPDRRGRVVFVYTRYFSEYFGTMPVGSIDVEEFKKYIHWRWDYWSNKKASGEEIPPNAAIRPAAKSLRSERQLLKQFLGWCKDNHIIHTVPNFPHDWTAMNIPAKQEKVRGKPLSDRHYQQLSGKLYAFACVAKWKKGMEDDDPDPMRYMETDVRTAWARLRLYYFVHLTGHLLLRQGTEATKLRWENVEHRVDKANPHKSYAVIRVLEGKKGRRDPVFCPVGRPYSQLLLWQRIARSFGTGQPSHHVFGDLNGGYVPAHYLGRLHSRCLKRWKLDKHPDGTNVTLYSYRHTAISRRIRLSGWDLIRVAKAANTSPLTISTSYAGEWMEAQQERYTNVHQDPADLDKYLNADPALRSQIENDLKDLGEF